MANMSGAEVEALLHQFSQPGSAHEIQQLEAQFREIQLSSQGWDVADYLLGRNDSTLQFFGAVTFRIKLGTGISELDDITVSQISNRILGWLITSVTRGDAPAVLRKLCSTLAYVCTLDRDLGAENIIQRVIMSMALREVVHYPEARSENATDPPDLQKALQSLTDTQLKVLLWFMTSLSEENTKESASSNTTREAMLANMMTSNLPDAATTLAYCFSPGEVVQGSKQQYTVQIEASLTTAVWIFCAQKQLWVHHDALIGPLRQIMDQVLDWLETSELDEAADVVSDVLYEWPGFFLAAHHRKIETIITGPWAQQCLQDVIAEPSEELPRFVRLLLAYTDNFLPRIIETPDDPLTQELMKAMHMLVQGPGFAGVEDVVAVEALEFWTQFVEHIADVEFEEDEEPKPWLPAANANTMQLFYELWKKVKLPTPEQYKELGTDRSNAFKQFRIDVKELLLAAFPALRTTMTEAIARLCLQALEKRDWLEVEASLFCLNAISIAEQESEDHMLSQLFGSDLFVHLKTDTSAPARARAMGVDVLGQYAEFFERHTEYLPSVLDFLFAMLQSAALAQKSAKAINRLCGSCRSSLVPQLPAFAQAYEQFLSWPTAEASTKEKVIGGVAAIAQALPTLGEQGTWLSMILRFVEQDQFRAQQEWSAGRSEEAQVAAMNAMRCLASISKAFQAADDDTLEPDDETAASHFWSLGPGHTVQIQIFDTIRVILEMFNASAKPLELHGDAIEAVCNVFKAGFTESKPGPFIFPPSSFIDFFSTMQLHTPRLEVVLSTSCSFLRSQSSSTSADVVQESARLAIEVVRLISSITNIREEDNTTGLLETLDRFLPRYTAVLFSLPQAELETLFGLTLECLVIPEPLPKRAAAQFWTSFISLTPARSKVSQEQLDSVITHFGPQLAMNLMRNVAGGAARSDLDWFQDPVKKMMTRTMHTKKFLEQALAAIDAGPNAPPDVKSRFLKQIAVANGASTVKKVIANFWSQCRGMTSSYSP